MHRLARGKVVDRPALAGLQIDQGGGLQVKGKTIVSITGGAVIQQRIDALQPFHRLAQRPRR